MARRQGSSLRPQPAVPIQPTREKRGGLGANRDQTDAKLPDQNWLDEDETCKMCRGSAEAAQQLLFECERMRTDIALTPEKLLYFPEKVFPLKTIRKFFHH